jgi:hypothetical protein
MKALQYLASVLLVLLGIALLCEPTADGEAFTPTRFKVVDEGAAGKPDVVLIPGLSSSRAVRAAAGADCGRIARVKTIHHARPTEAV